MNTVKLVAAWLLPVAAVLTGMQKWPTTPAEFGPLLMALLGSLAGVKYIPRS